MSTVASEKNREMLFIGNVFYKQWHLYVLQGHPTTIFRKNICLEDDLRSRIFETLACEQALLFGRVKRVSRERVSGRQSRSRVLARLASLAQIGELARRLSNSLCTDVPPPSGKIGRGDSPYFSWGSGHVCTQASYRNISCKISCFRTSKKWYNCLFLTDFYPKKVT